LKRRDRGTGHCVHRRTARVCYYLECPRHLPALHSFPTRRSSDLPPAGDVWGGAPASAGQWTTLARTTGWPASHSNSPETCTCGRSEEHTSELQSRGHLVCRLLLEKKSRLTAPCTSPAHFPTRSRP